MSKFKVSVVMIVTGAFAVSGFGQTKTVTNADLEKYREQRLEAERELRENYAELGFPSPEELAKQNEESRRELSALAERIRQEELERERQAQLARQYDDYYGNSGAVYPYPNPNFVDYGRYYAPSYIYGTVYSRRAFKRGGRDRFRDPRGGMHRFRGFFRDLRRMVDERRGVSRPVRQRGTRSFPGRRSRRN